MPTLSNQRFIEQYHFSKTPATAAVIEADRTMFERDNWKYHNENNEIIDVDTAPDKKKAFEEL